MLNEWQLSPFKGPRGERRWDGQRNRPNYAGQNGIDVFDYSGITERLGDNGGRTGYQVTGMSRFIQNRRTGRNTTIQQPVANLTDRAPGEVKDMYADGPTFYGPSAPKKQRKDLALKRSQVAVSAAINKRERNLDVTRPAKKRPASTGKAAAVKAARKNAK